MDSSRRLTRTEKAQLRRLELEKWKEEKMRKNLELKKNKRPPLRPAGKSSIFTTDLSTNSKLLKKKIPNPKIKSYSRKTTIGFDTRAESTAYSRVSFDGRSSNVKKVNKNDDTTFSFEDQGEQDIEKTVGFRLRKRKSVQFKERPEEIVTSPSPIKGNLFPYISPITDEQTKDDIRRRSYAGRTPFSCASSRSGSTPGRRDLPPSELKDMTDKSFGTPYSAKIKRRRNKDNQTLAFRCSISKSPYIDREPYMLRIRTPKITVTPGINTSTRKTPSKSFIKTREFITGDSRKKNLKVNFCSDVIKSPPMGLPPVLDLQKILSDKENIIPIDFNGLMEQNKNVSSNSEFSFLDEKYSHSQYLLRSPRSVNN